MSRNIEPTFSVEKKCWTVTMERKLIIFAAALLVGLAACERMDPRGDESESPEIKGFFLLNEGAPGSNKCTLDYYDYLSGVYLKNVFEERNPGLMPELGDAGNDLQIYGGNLYAVLSGSGLVKVMDATTARHLGTMSVPGCRYIVFQDGFAYVSAYGTTTDEDDPPVVGHVAKFDLETFEIAGTCQVGYDPEEMVISGGKLYVANSGYHNVPDYDHTISVIDLSTFEVVKAIEVAPNLHRLELDPNGILWVSSRGDYYDVPPRVYLVDTYNDQVIEAMEMLPCSEMTQCGDLLYVLDNTWNHFTQSSEASYALVDLKSHQIKTRHFITDGTDSEFQNPYGLAVNPQTGEFFVTDTRDNSTPGRVFCYTPEGRLKWSLNTGDIPSRIVFTTKRLQ